MGSFSLQSGRASGSGDVDNKDNNNILNPTPADLLPPMGALKVSRVIRTSGVSKIRKMSGASCDNDLSPNHPQSYPSSYLIHLL